MRFWCRGEGFGDDVGGVVGVAGPAQGVAEDGGVVDGVHLIEPSPLVVGHPLTRPAGRIAMNDKKALDSSRCWTGASPRTCPAPVPPFHPPGKRVPGPASRGSFQATAAQRPRAPRSARASAAGPTALRSRASPVVSNPIRMPRRSLLTSACSQAPLAQLAEQRTLNPRVRGSSPWRRTRSDLGFYKAQVIFFVSVLSPCLLARTDPAIRVLSKTARPAPDAGQSPRNRAVSYGRRRPGLTRPMV